MTLPSARVPARRPGARRSVTLAAWGVTLLGVAVMAATMWLTAARTAEGDPSADWATTVLFVLLQASVGLVGTVLVVRVPGNMVGWLLWASGLLLAIAALGQTYPAWSFRAEGPTALATSLAWAGQIATQAVLFMLIFVLPVIFPTGRPLSRTWRTWLVSVSFVGASFLVMQALLPGPLNDEYPVDNPLGLAVIADLEPFRNLVILVTAFVGFASQVIRYRSASWVERQQAKWFAADAGAMVTAVVLATLMTDETLANIAWGVAMLFLALLPVAIGIAVLRFRLYEVDHIVSRSIGWTLLTGLLLVVFVAATLVLQAALSRFTQDETIPVAVSTLLAAAAFQPLRGRIQRAVDRRFDRARYDGRRMADAFAERLRGEVAIDALATDLRTTIGEAVRPESSSLWLRGRPGAAGEP